MLLQYIVKQNLTRCMTVPECQNMEEKYIKFRNKNIVISQKRRCHVFFVTDWQLITCVCRVRCV